MNPHKVATLYRPNKEIGALHCPIKISDKRNLLTKKNEEEEESEENKTIRFSLLEVLHCKKSVL